MIDRLLEIFATLLILAALAIWTALIVAIVTGDDLDGVRVREYHDDSGRTCLVFTNENQANDGIAVDCTAEENQ